MQTRASLNHCKKMKAEPSRLIPRKLAANLEFLIVILWRVYILPQATPIEI